MFRFVAGLGDFSFSKASIPALDLAQLPTERWRGRFTVLKRPEREGNHSLISNDEFSCKYSPPL